MKRPSWRYIVAAVFLALASSTMAALPIHFDPDKMMRAAEVKRGMVGEAYTVFHGTEPTMFHVRILGVLPRGDLGQPHILFRAIDGPLIERDAPVMGGMSGSPVFINGKLIGAIAYTYLFEKEPCGGITGIEAMVEGVTGQKVAQTFTPQPVFIGGRLYRRVAVAGEDQISDDALVLHPCASPIYFTSGTQLTNRCQTELFKILGFDAVPGASQHEPIPVDIKPGSGLGVQLARGDFLAYTFGTVTWREGDVIIGFGHPLRSGGDINIPLTTVFIHDFVANYRRTDKDGEIMEPIGAITSDSPWAIGGQVGAQAPGLPAVFRIVDEKNDRAKTFAVELASDRVFTPSVAVGMLLSSLDALYHGSGQPGVAEIRYRVRGTKGAVFQRSDRFYFSSDPAAPIAPELSEAMRLFLDNRFEPQDLAEISAEVRVAPEQKVARIERVYTDEEAAVAGQKLTVHVVLKPVGEPLVEKTVSFELPWELPKSGVQVVAGGGAAADEIRRIVGGFVPEFHSLDAVIRYIESLERNDKLLVAIGLPRQGAAIDDTPLPGFPEDLTQRLALSHRSGVRAIKDYRLEVVDLPYVVQGLYAAALPAVTRRGERGKPTPPEQQQASALTEGMARISPIVSAVCTGALPAIAWQDGRPVAVRPRPSPPAPRQPVAEDDEESQEGQEQEAAKKKPDEGKVQAKQPRWVLNDFDKLAGGEPDGLAVHRDGMLVPLMRFDKVADVGDPIVWDILPTTSGCLVAAGLEAAIFQVADGGTKPWAKLPKGIFVSCLASPDNQHVACATCPDATLYLLDAAGNTLKSFGFDESYIWDIVPDSGGRLLVATGQPARIYELSPSTGERKLLAVLPEEHVRYLAAAKSGLFAATCDRNAVYRVYSDGRVVQIASFDSQPCGMAALGNGKIAIGLNGEARIVCVSETGSVEEWVRLKGKTGYCLTAVGKGVLLGAGPSATAVYAAGPTDWALVKWDRAAAGYAAAGVGPDGRCWLASAGPASVFAQDPKPSTLAYTTPAQDAGRLAKVLSVIAAATPDARGLRISTRTGASPDFDGGMWSAWAPAEGTGPDFVPASPPNRYCQVRVEAPGEYLGRVLSLIVKYAPQNQPPTLKVTVPEPGG
ncbi:MAG: hypothetical protein H5T86_06315, partial [Armatimonadetes bacterium]|nr:hypothetical protein [Armatimonadota bacterium]